MSDGHGVSGSQQGAGGEARIDFDFLSVGSSAYVSDQSIRTKGDATLCDAECLMR